MRAADARKACPDITLVHVETISEGTEDMSADQGDSLAPDRRTQKACLRRYRQASEEVFAVVQRHAARCEMASIDEVYLDLTEEANQRVASGALDFPQLATSAVCPSGCTADAKDSHLLAALDLVQKLRDDIFTDTGFTVSAGISESKLVAKLASACHKPNRQTLVPSAGVLSFMAAVKLKDLRGLGGKLGQKLRSSLQLDPEAPSAELQKVPLVELQRILGEQSAAFVHRLCRGEDNEDVKPGEMKRKQYLSFKSLSPPAERIHADELDVILSRVKLAQLLGRGEGSVSWSVPPGRLTLVDYTMHNAVIQDLQAEKLLEFFFGHRSHSESFGKGPVQRWLHLRGCHLMLLMALTVKYRLSPLGVEDIIEQGPTKVDLHGVNVFITLDQLHVKNSTSGCRSGSSPVQIGSSHVTLILSAPHRPDTLISVVQPTRNANKDGPISDFCRVDSQDTDDAWVEILRQRLKRTRSRLSEHDVRYVGLQIVQLCVDNLISVVRAFGARLGYLDQELQSDRAQVEVESNTPDASWLNEVSTIRLQLAVVARRLRNARNMLRRLEQMVPDDMSMGRRLTGYLQDVSDDVDGALEDASHLVERCNALSSAYDAALSREHAAQRRVAKEAERIEQVKQNKHAQKLNDILFVLTTATALFAPVQFLAGVYGMNFAVNGDPTIPELKMEYGYLYFWIIVIAYLFGSGTLAVRLFRKLRIKQEAAQLLRNRQGTFSTLAGESPRLLEGSPHDEGISSPYHRLM